MTDKIKIENLEKLKVAFDVNENKQKEIEKELLEIEVKIINKKFNPKDNNIMEIYDIMDNISDWKIQLSKVLKKSIRYEMSAELLGKTFEKVNNDIFADLLLSEELKSKALKNADEKKAWVSQKMNENGMLDYSMYAEKQKIKSKNTFKQIMVVADVVKELDEKNSRKVSVMQVQQQLGQLGTGTNK